jgi:hypothetical protein
MSADRTPSASEISSSSSRQHRPLHASMPHVTAACAAERVGASSIRKVQLGVRRSHMGLLHVNKSSMNRIDDIIAYIDRFGELVADPS